MFLYIVLICVKKLEGERSVSGIYNLLTGKRSSQTLQDSKAYHLEGYFGISKHLDRQEFQHFFKRACEERYIAIDHQHFPVITKQGEEYVRSYQGPHFSYFRGMSQHQSVLEFERRLLLLIQTLTNMQVHNRSFIPIVEHPKAQMWVKRVFAQMNGKITDMTSSLYSELEKLLGLLSEFEAELFTYRLTGGGVIGLTREQLTAKFGVSSLDVDIVLQHVYYFLYERASQDYKEYPVLFRCTEELEPSVLITQSAKRTYQYIKQGFTLEEITKKRRLKMSTIQDHIVEAALVTPDFSIDKYVSMEDQKLIVQAADNLKTQRLKVIYQALEGQYSYFQLRLVLAVASKSKQEGNNYARI